MKRWLASPVVRQGGSYGVVGVAQFLLDWAIYVALTHAGMTVALANVLARVGGASAGFVLNGAVTFRDHDGARLGWARFTKFAMSWSVLTLLSTVALVAIDDAEGLQASWLGKPLVDVALAGAGFLIARRWIYR